MIFKENIYPYLGSICHNILEVGAVNILQHVQPLVQRDILVVHLHVVENIQQFLSSFDFVQRNGDNMALGLVGNSLDGRSLPAARLTVEQKAHGVRNTPGFVPGLVVLEKVDASQNIFLFREKYVVEGFSGFKPEKNIFN